MRFSETRKPDQNCIPDVAGMETKRWTAQLSGSFVSTGNMFWPAQAAPFPMLFALNVWKVLKHVEIPGNLLFLKIPSFPPAASSSVQPAANAAPTSMAENCWPRGKPTRHGAACANPHGWFSKGYQLINYIIQYNILYTRLKASNLWAWWFEVVATAKCRVVKGDAGPTWSKRD